MALTTGTEAADSGLSGAIYIQLDALLAGAFTESGPEVLAAARDGWRKLAFAIAEGVVSHLLANLEVGGVTVDGSVSLTSGSTNSHTHTVTGTVSLAQNNNGTGRVT